MKIAFCFFLIVLSPLALAEKVSPNSNVKNFITVRDLENQGVEIAKLLAGESAELLDTLDTSYYIQLENGTVGFVLKNWAALILEPVISDQAALNTSASTIETTDSLSNTGLMSLHFIDVGHGDSSLIICPDNTSILIDIGINAGNKGNENTLVISDYLKEVLGAENKVINTLIISQGNEDYVNHLSEFLTNFSVGHIFHTESSDNINSIKLNGLIGSSNSKSTQLNTDYFNPTDTPIEDIPCGDADIFVLAAGEFSIVLKVQFKDFSAILSSNSNHKAEEIILSRYDTNFLNIDVLKTSNHGDINSSNSSQWLNSTKPLIAVISAGKENESGLPSNELIDRLSPYTLSQNEFTHSISTATKVLNELTWETNLKFDELIYSTADNGNIDIKSSGYDADISFSLHTE